MAVNVRAKVYISAQLKEAMAKSPKIVGDELAYGMREVREIRDDARENALASHLFLTGRLVRNINATVIRDEGRADVTGIVRSGARHGPIQEHGGTIKAKNGGWLVFPVGEQVIITHTQQRNGEWRQLKRERLETIPQRFIRVKQVTIKPTWYFRKGTKTGLPKVEASLETSAYRALNRVFATDSVATEEG